MLRVSTTIHVACYRMLRVRATCRPNRSGPNADKATGRAPAAPEEGVRKGGPAASSAPSRWSARWRRRNVVVRVRRYSDSPGSGLEGLLGGTPAPQAPRSRARSSVESSRTFGGQKPPKKPPSPRSPAVFQSGQCGTMGVLPQGEARGGKAPAGTALENARNAPNSRGSSLGRGAGPADGEKAVYGAPGASRSCSSFGRRAKPRARGLLNYGTA